MNRKALVLLAMLALLLPVAAVAQDDNDSDTKGRVLGRYQVRQSIEFGGRIVGNSGNQDMYNTLVNLRTGPRLLGQELSMRSMDRNGGLFDSLYLSSFGFGGDPNDVARLRIEKNKWYNFVGLYRRDQNYFNYNLWANPLNPNYPNSTLTSNAAYLYSPHLQNTTRNMGDFNLTLFPQSKFRVRLGYSRNDNQGNIFSSLHETNEVNLLNNFHTRSDRWQFGVDVRPIKRTTISFDQFIVHDKTDNNENINPLFGNSFPLGTATGPSVNIGFPYASFPYNTPCANGTTVATARPAVNGGVLLGTCTAGYYLYNYADNVRTTLPTSQLSLQSNYFRKLDITASGTYTSGSVDVLNITDNFRGLVSRTGTEAYSHPGSAHADRYEASASLGLTYHITRKWAVSDEFKWLDWRTDGTLSQTAYTCYGALGTGSNIGTAIGNPCLIPSAVLSGFPANTVAGTVPAALVGNALITNAPAITFLGQRTYTNTAKLAWAPTRKVNAYVGYRYRRLELNDKGSPASGAGSTTAIAAGGTTATVTNSAVGFATGDTTAKVNEHVALGGVVFRPITAWRINADVELLTADRCTGCGMAGFNTVSFTNLTPRHQQRYRVGSTYRVRKWVSVNGAVHIIESRTDYGAANLGTGSTFAYQNSNVAATGVPYGNQNHTRYYSFGVNLDPTRRIGLDLGYTYMDQKINAASCMPVGTTVMLSNGVAESTAIPAANSCYATAGDLPVLLAYQEKTNTGYFNLRFKPMKRVTLNAGYELTSSSGFNNWIRMDNGQPLLVQTYGSTALTPGAAVLSNATTGVFAPAGTGAGPNPLVPSGGSLDTNWHKPFAGITISIRKGLDFKGFWYYYGYNEKDVQNASVVLPRDFHANTGTVSLRYAF